MAKDIIYYDDIYLFILMKTKRLKVFFSKYNEEKVDISGLIRA